MLWWSGQLQSWLIFFVSFCYVPRQNRHRRDKYKVKRIATQRYPGAGLSTHPRNYVMKWRGCYRCFSTLTNTILAYKKLSCRREAARCFVFVCSQLQYTYSAVFFITSYCGFRFTSAENSIKFCSAVSYCLRWCPTKTPRTNTPRS